MDFPVAFRAWGPLDSIAQVAGRCNRNGRLEAGRMRVFVPEDEEYPDRAYAQAAATARAVGMARSLDTDDPDVFREYYCRLYAVARPEQRNERLLEAIERQDFAEVAELYHVIPDATINVLVPYQREAFSVLAGEVRQQGISRDWVNRARLHTIGIYRPRPNAPVARWLEPVPGTDGATDSDWYVYLKPEHYNHKTGLTPPEALDCLIG